MASSLLIATVCAFSSPTLSTNETVEPLPAFLNGITLENVLTLNDEQVTALRSVSVPIIVRVVFNRDVEPEGYKEALARLHSITFLTGKRKIFLMGELLDSDFLARYKWDCQERAGCTFDENPTSNFHDYKTRIERYLNVLDRYIDLWEVGNEVNGEWADEGCVKDKKDNCRSKKVHGRRVSIVPARPDITAKKIRYAIVEVIRRRKPVALTLIHQPECTTWDDNSMFDWSRANLLPILADVKINYLFISYYEDNCDQGKQTVARDSPNLSDQIRRTIYWTQVYFWWTAQEDFIRPELFSKFSGYFRTSSH